LGSVELTLALHYCFNTPKDKIVWDVGHQTYAHKIITGRKDRFYTLRQYKGISGFPKTAESMYDVFNVGHSSTSISAALGMAIARDIQGLDEKIIAIIGDGALSSGIAYEGLDNAGYMDTDLIVIVNDNNMSISPSLGAISTYLSKKMTGPIYNKLRNEIEKAINTLPIVQKPTLKIARKIEESIKFFSPGLLFEELGFKYFGPINGHKIEDLVTIFRNVKNIKGPVVIHVLTTKGKGYEPAEKNPSLFHGVGKFDVDTGKLIKVQSKIPSYSSIFGDKLLDIFKKKENVVAITAAMLLGTGLEKVKNAYPDRVFDVGIAEQHAVTMAGGLAISGIKPIVAIYSTFLQRAYDQIIHDIALQKLPVVFAIDRAGLVGDDGETHQGSFDISYLNLVPNMIISAPKDLREFKKLLELAASYKEGPFAIRYPRGEAVDFGEEFDDSDIKIGSWQVLKKGEDVAVLAVGSCVEMALDAQKLMESDISVEIVNARFIKPMDISYLAKLKNFKAIITIEENSEIGGFGSEVAKYIALNNLQIPIKIMALPDEFIEQGDKKTLMESVGLSAQNIVKNIEALLNI
jgi:1-deoxy-D-xylulose-5-phosphate synthase